MALTFLQLINRVLVNLREATVTTNAQSSYSSLIGSFVNQAKEKVEDAWNWRALTVSATFTTVLAQQQYILDGTGTPTVAFSPNRVITDRGFIIRDKYGNAEVFATNIPVVSRLREYAFETLIGELRQTNPINNQMPWGYGYTLNGGQPTLWLARPTDSNNGAGYNIEARFCQPQVELVNDTDTLIVPYRPVVSYATMMACNERGEELGNNADMWMAIAQDELARAVTSDQEAAALMLRND